MWSRGLGRPRGQDGDVGTSQLSPSLGICFSTRMFFQQCKCVFSSESPVCHASQLIPLDWVTRWVGLFFSECFQLFHFCLCALSAYVHFFSRGVPLSHDAAPSTSCEYNSHFASSLSSPAYHFLLLPISTYVSLAWAGGKELKFNIYSALITVLNNLCTSYYLILTAGL